MYEVLNKWITPWAENSYSIFIVLLILSIVLGFYLLIKGGDLLSDHSSNIAYQLGVPPVVVGLTIVSIATSAPELFTSFSALRSNSPGLVLGNIIGSNIANIGLILGIALFLGKISTKGAVSLVQRHCLFWVTLAFCMALFLLPNGILGLIPGSLLLLFIISYLFVITTHSLRNKNKPTLQNEKIGCSKTTKSPSLLFSFFMLLISTIALWVGSDSLVYGSKTLAHIVGVPEELIGFTVLAIGTSLPELAASISLVKSNQTAMLLGNIVGSNLFNISLIGGIAGIFGPVASNSTYAWVDYLSLLSITMLLIFWLKGRELNRDHGILLLTIYLFATATTWILNS